MSCTPFYVGLDVGGSSMKGGVVDDNGQPLSAVSLATEAQRGQEFGLERMCETIRQAIAAAGVGQDQVAAVGVATPGTMDIPAGVILDPPTGSNVTMPARWSHRRKNYWSPCNSIKASGPPPFPLSATCSLSPPATPN